MSVLPVVFLIVGGVVAVAVLSLIFLGSERLTQRLTRGRFREREGVGSVGAGELFGEQGLIARGRGDDLYPRDENR